MKFAFVAVTSLVCLPLLAGAFSSERSTHPYAGVDSSRASNLQTMALLNPAHNINPTPSHGGADIMTVEDRALLPDSGPSGTLADVDETPVNPGNVSLYVVREGDSLGEIAEMFEVTTDTIRWANDLRGSTITEGDVLVILPVSGVRHVVEEGETLDEIANTYDADVDKILAYNDVSASALSVGTELTIPEGRVTASADSSRSISRPSSSGAGYYIRPIDGGYKSQGHHGYNAVDIAANPGSPIYAAASGVVEESRHSGWNGGYGKMVVIRHDNGTKTLYAHNSSNLVDKGQRVAQGQVIGYVGNTGRSTGPHLHFEVRGASNPF